MALIQVSNKIKGHSILNHIKLYGLKYDDIQPDFILNDSTCAVILSLKYHNLYPNYIYEKLSSVGKKYRLQILLIFADINDPHSALKELSKACLLAEWTMMCCWSVEEGAKIIETYKSSEKKSASSIMEKPLSETSTAQDKAKCVVEALSKVKSINKTDGLSLVANFESLDKIVKASYEQLTLCPGLGPLKVSHSHFYCNSYLILILTTMSF